MCKIQGLQVRVSRQVNLVRNPLRTTKLVENRAQIKFTSQGRAVIRPRFRNAKWSNLACSSWCRCSQLVKFVRHASKKTHLFLMAFCSLIFRCFCSEELIYELVSAPSLSCSATLMPKGRPSLNWLCRAFFLHILFWSTSFFISLPRNTRSQQCSASRVSDSRTWSLVTV
jgi:hypothetical protein